MARLPQPGGDDGDWGDILNNFLAIEHNTDGTLKSSGSLADKEPRITAGTLSQYFRGDKTWQNIDTDSALSSNSDIKISSQKAIKSYVDTSIAAGATTDATTTVSGKIQLTGDLGGTAASPTTPTAVHVTGAETITGVKTFSSSPNMAQINDANGNPWLKVNTTAAATGGFAVTNNTAGSTVTLANANTGNAPTIFKGAGTGLMTIRPGVDSIDAFRLQNASGTGNYFGLDSNNGRIAVGGSGSQTNSTLTVLGSVSTPIVAKSSNYTLGVNDATILASGNITVTLPSAIGITGRKYTIKKTDAATTTVLVATTASQGIDGTTSVNLTTQYTTLRVQSDGAKWWIV
jgi:hypothetical protein